MAKTTAEAADELGDAAESFEYHGAIDRLPSGECTHTSVVSELTNDPKRIGEHMTPRLLATDPSIAIRPDEAFGRVVALQSSARVKTATIRTAR